ncbi:zinc finger protein 692 isoform X1 [Bombina bombina]|uniref:zinc finger protein 692 isoform X1 n=1 Tax=Bombina bombina TaxID=8345 RepID=UPI00235A4DFE|nr:zinc finger protein 692 isoform X1 [Bombina bombina]
MQAADRREKRRLLDAQRGKCRVRLGCHLDEWCCLKESLGFSLHSQLAKFLLDSYKSVASTRNTVTAEVILLSVSLSSLNHLIQSCHQHGRDCQFTPSLLPMPSFEGLQENQGLLWGCKADHCFYWNPQEERLENQTQLQCSNSFEDKKRQSTREDILEKDERPQENLEEEKQGKVSKEAGQSEEIHEMEEIGHLHSKSKEGILRFPGGWDSRENESCLGAQLGTPESAPQNKCVQESVPRSTRKRRKTDSSIEQADKDENENSQSFESSSQTMASESGVVTPVSCRSSSRQEETSTLDQIPEESTIPDNTQDSDIESVPESDLTMETLADMTTLQIVPPEMDRESKKEQGTVVKGHSGAKKGQSCTPVRPLVDDELAQICKKRIRKATPHEILLCEYEGCGKIFSKRQYLNYHQKYQHMNQHTFCCSAPDCGRSFNFKKHLKEHEKRHSDKRDFICEFCARAFRSSSNLIIHRRIHTGEKPIQCEFCGFTCRQKASLNWHMKKHAADSFYQFPCDICGQRFEKRDNLAAHRSRKHPTPRKTVSEEAANCETSSRENISETAPCQTSPPEMVSRTDPQDTVETSISDKCQDLTERAEDKIESVATGEQTVGNSENVSAGISLVIIL